MEDVVKTIDIFKNLSHPTQRRIQDVMRVEEINCYGEVPITNGVYSDFIYVCSGSLKIDFVKQTCDKSGITEKSEELV